MKKSRSRYPFSLALVVLALLLAAPAHAATLTVKSNADAGGTCPGASCTLRQAIATAVAGDTIDFSVTGTIALTSGTLVIDKNLVVSGPGASKLNLAQSGLGAAVQSSSVIVTISGLTIGPGTAGVYVESGSLALNDCAVSGNVGNGGLLTLVGTNLNMNRCTISGNQNEIIMPGLQIVADGGGLQNRGTATLTNCTISGNTTKDGGNGTQSGHGGGINNVGGTVSLINCTIAGNTGEVGGGGIQSSNGGTFQLIDTIVSNNSSPNGPDCSGTFTSNGYNFIGIQNGGTGFSDNVNHDIVGTAATPRNPFLGPLQDNGGPTKTRALLSGSTAIEAGNSSVSNTTDQRGFARRVDSPTIVNVGDGSDIGAYEVQADVLPGCSGINTVVKNNNDSGPDSLRGIIANVCAGSTITFAPNVTGPITLTSGELLLNKSLTIIGAGPKVFGVSRSSAAGTANFRIFNIATNTNVTITAMGIANGNAASSFGGAISNSGTLTLIDDFLTANTAVFGAGAIHNNGGVLTINRSVIFDNMVNSGAAGILNSSGSTLTIINSLISGNGANGGNGGGIVNSGTVTLVSTTISANFAQGGAGGGIHNASGTVTSKNSIIAKNLATSAPDYNGALVSQGFNLIGNSSGTTISPAQFSDQVGNAGSPLDPLLGIFQDNGGLTFTRGLLPGSPALDKGDSGSLATDERGFPRPINLVNTSNANGGDGSDIGAFEVQATTLANISTRLRVETGDGALFAGFIVTGTQPKKVIIRAIGPSIALADHLADPILELHDSFGATLDSNDNWQDSANKQAIIDSTVAPTNPLESAIVATLPAGNAGYTAIIRGANNGTGIGVVEAYDLDTLANSKLANISTRGLVQTGDNVLFAGTIVVGQESQKVIIRALGPSTGVPGSMADPTLELRDGQGAVLETNDNWVDSPNKQAIIDSTIPPTNDKESAIVRLLPPANYTAILRGADGTTGIGVIEVYALN